MTIGQRIMLYMGVGYLIVLASQVVSYRGLSEMNSQFVRLVEKDQTEIIAYKDMYANGLQMGQAVRNITLNPTDEKAKANLKGAAEEFQKAFVVASNLADSEAERALLADIAEKRKKQDTIQSEIIEKAQVSLQETVSYLNKNETPLWREIRSALLKKIDAETKGVLERKKTTLASASNSMTTSVVLTILSAIVLAAFFYMFSRSITRSLHNLLVAMQGIADGQGDLTSRLDEKGNDEFAEIAKAFNRFTENIRRVVGSTFVHSGQITKQSVLLSQVAEKTSRYMRNQNTQTHQAVTAVEQMTSTVRTNADNANTALRAAQNAEYATKEGASVVCKTREAILQLAHKVIHASQVIGKANSVTGEISEILNVIRDIADQTNLLALNAAIEAASAGEHGRGFAVVAEEVRTLSKRTNVATEEIQKIIAQLLDESKKAVAAMDHGSKMTQEVVGHADMAEKSLQTIIEEVEKLTQMLNQIAGATEEQSVTADTIANNMSIISKAGIMTSTSVDETESICRQLSDLSEEMMNASGNIRTGVPNLTRAKVAHLAWRVKLRKFMHGETSLSLAEAVDHQSCVFGKWYYSEGLKLYSDIKEMVDIEGPHERLHSLIREAVQQKNAGQLSEEASEEVQMNVEKISAHIVDMLDAVEKKLLDRALVAM